MNGLARFLFVFIVSCLLGCSKAAATAHVVYFDGTTVRILSDGIRTRVNGIPPEHVCKNRTAHGLVLITWGDLGTERVHTDGTITHLGPDFNSQAEILLQKSTSASDAHTQMEQLTRRFLEDLKRSSLRAPLVTEEETEFSIGGALLWFEGGIPYIHQFDLTIPKTGPTTSPKTKPNKSRRLLSGELCVYPAADCIKSPALIGGTNIWSSLVVAPDKTLSAVMDSLASEFEKLYSSHGVGKPYSIVHLTQFGVERASKGGPCEQTISNRH